MVRGEFVDYHRLLALVAVPPNVVRLDEGVGEAVAGSLRFSGACGTPVEFVLKSRKRFVLRCHQPKEFKRRKDALELGNSNEPRVNSTYSSQLQKLVVEVRVGFLSRCFRGFAKAHRRFDSGVLFGTVVPRSNGRFTNLHVTTRELTYNATFGGSVGKQHAALKVRGSGSSFFQLKNRRRSPCST